MMDDMDWRGMGMMPTRDRMVSAWSYYIYPGDGIRFSVMQSRPCSHSMQFLTNSLILQALDMSAADRRLSLHSPASENEESWES
jgi:hypothetical protein